MWQADVDTLLMSVEVHQGGFLAVGWVRHDPAEPATTLLHLSQHSWQRGLGPASAQVDYGIFPGTSHPLQVDELPDLIVQPGLGWDIVRLWICAAAVASGLLGGPHTCVVKGLNGLFRNTHATKSSSVALRGSLERPSRRCTGG